MVARRVRSWFGTISFLLALIAASSARAAESLSLASPFTDHMVIQREAPITVWGRAEPKSQVSVTLGNETKTATADEAGKWSVELPSLEAGGPYELSVKAGDASLTRKDILVGDVWLCSGQSNMQFTLGEAIGGKELAGRASQSGELRLLMVPKAPADQPADKFDAAWSLADEPFASRFTAVGMFFEDALRHYEPSLQSVPIGLIDSSFGGTRVEGWMPADLLAREFKPEDLHLSIFNIKPTQLYNAMIAPLAGLRFKGVLWYQGESNTAQAAKYPELLAAMIRQWRGDFHDPALPFYLVQLANYPEPWEGYSFADLRDAQSKVAHDVDHVWIAVTSDTPDGYDLHPKHKQLIGDRLARLALANTYGKEIVAQGPVFKSAKADGGSMRVEFDVGKSALVLKPAATSGFELAGEDGVFYAAAAKQEDSAVILTSDQVKSPKFVRYAYRADPDNTVFNTEGIPASLFRTDTLPPTPMVEVQRVRAPRRVVTQKYAVRIESDGRLSSLLVNGQEMLSGDEGGGFLAASVWGPRRLYEVTELGPRAVRYADGGCSITYRFDDDAIHVIVQNNADKDPLATRCQMSQLAGCDESAAAEKRWTFARDHGRVTVENADAAEKVGDQLGQMKLDVPAKQTREIVFRPSNP